MGGIFITESFLRIEIDIFMVILLSIVLIHSVLQLNLKLIKYKLFITASSLCVTSLCLEIITSLARDFSMINSVSTFRILNTLAFALSAYTPLFIYYFVIKTTTGIFEERSAAIISIPAIFNIILSILSYKLNIYFNISNTDTYSRGPLFFVSPSISVFYYALVVIHVLKNTYYLEKDEMFVFLNAVLLPFFLGSIQLLSSLHLTVCASYAISMVILYIFILNDNSKRDAMTGLGNKTKYYDCINMFKKKGCENLKVISLDLDDFKIINDTYGHTQGDIAIQRFAVIIYDTFKEKSKIVRFGGDEFIIFTFNDNIDMLLKSLETEVLKFNTSSVLPFDLNYSYGIVDQNDSINSKLSIEELIKKSDETLYLNKKNKKQ